MADDRVTITLELDPTTFQAELKKVEESSKKTGDKISKTLKKDLEGGLSEGVKAGITAVTTSEAFQLVKKIGGYIFDSFKEGIQGAREQEQSIIKMNQALSLAGDFSREASNAFVEFADKTELATGHSAELIMNMVALGKTMGATNKQTQDMVTAATDLSAVTGVSLESAMRALGLSLNGNIGLLAKFFPQLKTMSVESLKAGDAIKYITDRFGGSAAANMNNFEGALFRFNKAIDDSNKSLGFLVTRSPAVQAALEGLTEAMNQMFALTATGDDIAKPLLQGLIYFAQAVNSLVLAPIEVVFTNIRRGFSLVAYPMVALAEQAVSIFNLISGGASETGKNLESMATKLRGSLESFIKAPLVDTTYTDRIAESLGTISGAVENTSGKLREMGDVATNTGNQLQESLDLSLQSATSFSDFFGILKDNVSSNMAITADMMSNATGQLVAKNLEAKNAILKNNADVAKSLQNTFATGASNAFVAFGNALATGEDGLAAFGKAILGAFGDMLIQLGTQTLAVGLGMSAVPILFGFQGSAAIAAGGIMLAAGGLLKGLAGGGGGGGGAAAASAPSDTGGGVNAGLDNTVGENIDTQINQVAERELPQTNVSVNVSGIVTNPRETAEQIAQLLKDGFETNDLNVRGSFV